MSDEERGRVRTRILAAAEAVFSRSGFERARIDDVAAEAGVSTGTVYNYFPGKTSLILDLHRRSVEDSNEEVAALLAKAEPFVGKLDRYLVSFFHFGRENRAFLAVVRESPHLLHLSPRHVEEQVRRFSQLVERHVELVADLLRAGIEEGSLEPGEPYALASALLGMAKALAFLPKAADRMDPADMAAMVRDLFLRGAGRRAPGWTATARPQGR